MQLTATTFTITEYCDQMTQGKIIVNRDYQRTSKVWPPAARSYLIDTILHGYPMPKISLYQKTDLRTRQTIKEIVDGQQRSQAILDFYNDKLQLSGNSDFSGLWYKSLEEEYQQKFIEYQLSVDVFVGATDIDIREVFRRMNSYTVPLNPQEKRHATFQGAFKWFIVEMSEQWSQTFKELGVFSERQLSRMNDAALMTDIVYSLENGNRSASEPNLDKLYKEHESEFDSQQLKEMLEYAFGFIIEMPELHKGALMKTYNFFSLVLAIIHIKMGPIPAFQNDFDADRIEIMNNDLVLSNLSLLAEILENPQAEQQFSSFIEACSKATNRIAQRKERFRWFCKALTRSSLP